MGYTKDREEFIAQVSQEGLPVYVIRQILAKANILQRIAELQCSSESADRDRVRCPGVRHEDDCICDQYEGDGKHDSVPRIDRQAHRIKKQLNALLDGRKCYCVTDSQNENVLYVGKDAEDCARWINQSLDYNLKPYYRLQEREFKLNFQGDPRGAVVKLTVPSGKYDDMSREGLCVPSKGLPANYWDHNR